MSREYLATSFLGSFSIKKKFGSKLTIWYDLVKKNLNIWENNFLGANGWFGKVNFISIFEEIF